MGNFAKLFISNIMANIINEVSRTFNEYLIIPGLTTKEHTPDKISLRSPVTKFKRGDKPHIVLNVPFVSAIMQSVSDSKLAIALAKEGGLSFIYGSQSIEQQANMVQEVKKYKAGFVESRANITPDATLADIIELKEKSGFSTVGVTHDGSPCGVLLGLVTSRDYRVYKDPLNKRVKEFMTPFNNLITAQDGISLIQTAEGSLNETHSILQRMRELSVQSANDTNTAADRAELQKEVDQLSQELSRIGANTEFNTQKLLNGNFKGTFHTGANES